MNQNFESEIKEMKEWWEIKGENIRLISHQDDPTAIWALTSRPDRGRPAHWHGWWAPSHSAYKRRWGSGAPDTRFTAAAEAPIVLTLVRSRERHCQRREAPPSSPHCHPCAISTSMTPSGRLYSTTGPRQHHHRRQWWTRASTPSPPMVSYCCLTPLCPFL
jgi:hypothetical protein